MPAGKYNFVIEQGTDLNIPIVVKNNDGSSFSLDGYSAAMQMRTLDLSTEIDELTTANSRITIESFTYAGSTYWRIILLFPNADTSGYTFDTCVYDLEITSPADLVTRLIEGTITLSPEVTV
jgi:hypothetical protein